MSTRALAGPSRVGSKPAGSIALRRRCRGGRRCPRSASPSTASRGQRRRAGLEQDVVVGDDLHAGERAGERQGRLAGATAADEEHPAPVAADGAAWVIQRPRGAISSCRASRSGAARSSAGMRACVGEVEDGLPAPGLGGGEGAGARPRRARRRRSERRRDDRVGAGRRLERRPKPAAAPRRRSRRCRRRRSRASGRHVIGSGEMLEGRQQRLAHRLAGEAQAAGAGPPTSSSRDQHAPLSAARSKRSRNWPRYAPARSALRRGRLAPRPPRVRPPAAASRPCRPRGSGRAGSSPSCPCSARARRLERSLLGGRRRAARAAPRRRHRRRRRPARSRSSWLSRSSRPRLRSSPGSAS